MICNFSKSSDATSIVMYNEEKVSQGKAFLLCDGTFSFAKKPSEYLKVFSDTVSLNSHVRSNKIFHCSVNLPSFEKLSDEKFLELAKEYLNEMGYSNCPYLVYKHNDTKHNHLHIITTTVDYSGDKVNDYNDHYNSERISRDLEKKHGLFVVKKSGYLDKKKLSEINASRYSVSTAICRGFKNNDKKHEILKYIPYSFYVSIKSNPVENQKLLSSIGEDKYNSLLGFLFDKSYIKTLYKENLLKIVSPLSYNSREEFENKCKESGIYIRAVFYKGKPAYVYGIAENNFYIKQSKLPKRFSFENILLSGSRTFTFDNQKNYIQKIASQVLKQSSSIDDYRLKLKQKNIELIVYENKSGISGISYRSTGIENPFIIKSSSFVGLSFKDISLSFESKENHLSDLAFQSLAAEQGIQAAPDLPISGKKRHQDEEYPKKKKRKKKGPSL